MNVIIARQRRRSFVDDGCILVPIATYFHRNVRNNISTLIRFYFITLLQCCVLIDINKTHIKSWEAAVYI